MVEYDLVYKIMDDIRVDGLDYTACEQGQKHIRRRLAQRAFSQPLGSHHRTSETRRGSPGPPTKDDVCRLVIMYTLFCSPQLARMDVYLMATGD